jgi:hypothetical protein
MADLGFLLLWYPFPFKVSFQKALSMNLGWVDVDRVAGHQKYILFPRCLETKPFVHFPRKYSIYSFAHLSWHSTCANELRRARFWTPATS